MDKKIARMFINDLMDGYCKKCTKPLPKKCDERAEYCRENCEVGQKLKQLGVILDQKVEKLKKIEKVKPLEKPIDLKDRYLHLKTQGLKVGEIAKQLGMTTSTLYYKLNKWGFVEPKEKKVKKEPAERLPITPERLTVSDPAPVSKSPADYMKQILAGEEVSLQDEEIKTMLENAMKVLGMQPNTKVVSTWTIKA